MTKKDFGLFMLIVVVGAVVAILNPRFILPINLSNTSNLVGMFGLLSIGKAFVIITGGIELSVGSNDRADRRAVRRLRREQWRALDAGGGLMLAVVVVVWLVHGFLITKLNLQPFIVTLCGFLFYRGIARCYTEDGTAGFEFGQSFPTLEWIAAGRTYGVPHTFVIFLLVASIMWVLLHRSIFGRYLYAIGKNEEAARFSGIRNRADHRGGLRHLPARSTGDRVDFLRHVHPLDIAGLARQFLRALCASPRPFSAVARCAAARGRSSASFSGRCCFRNYRTWSICLASPVLSISP